MDKKDIIAYLLLGIIASEAGIMGYLQFQDNLEITKLQHRINSLENILKNHNNITVVEENNTIIYVNNYNNTIIKSTNGSINNGTTKYNNSCNSITCFEEKINQSELDALGTDSNIVILKVTGASPSGNLQAFDPYNNRSIAILQSPGFSTYNQYGTSKYIPISQILANLSNTNNNLYVILKINNKNNIVKSGILNLGNGSIEVLPGSTEAYIIAPYSPMSLKQILNEAISNPNLPVLLPNNQPDTKYVPDSTFGGMYSNGSYSSIIIQAQSQSQLNNILNLVKTAGALLGNASMTNPTSYGMDVILIPQKISSYYNGTVGENITQIIGNYNEFIAFSPEYGNGWILINQIMHKDPSSSNAGSQYVKNLKGLGSGDFVGKSIRYVPNMPLYINSEKAEDLESVFSE